MRSRYGWPYSLTQTNPPPAAVAHGAAMGESLIFATTAGVLPVTSAVASTERRRTRIPAEYSEVGAKSCESGLFGQGVGEDGSELGQRGARPLLVVEAGR